ncbi:hypothetical protein GF342_00585 [Candidatus Woesearchaeota archaeon]|nr:hypothetical protein [Candidatus Woesearchaeota archaeon]
MSEESVEKAGYKSCQSGACANNRGGQEQTPYANTERSFGREGSRLLNTVGYRVLDILEKDQQMIANAAVAYGLAVNMGQKKLADRIVGELVCHYARQAGLDLHDEYFPIPPQSESPRRPDRPYEAARQSRDGGSLDNLYESGGLGDMIAGMVGRKLQERFGYEGSRHSQKSTSYED